MKKLYQILQIAFGGVLGAYFGTSLYRYCDYVRRPGLHAARSRPWYAGIRAGGALTAAILLVLTLCMWRIKRRWK